MDVVLDVEIVMDVVWGLVVVTIQAPSAEDYTLHEPTFLPSLVLIERF